MNTITDFTGKTQAQLIREMRPAEVLDWATDAYFRYIKLRTVEACEEYNWWVDVYNFKRGKRVLKAAVHHPVKVGGFESYYGERSIY